MCVDFQNKRLVLVLGMHRSGTSLISRALKIFGASHGDNLIPPTVDNAKGHWEDKDFFVLNEEMLAAIGKTWNSALPITLDDVNSLQKQGFFEKAVSLITTKFANTEVFALKDPRITKLLLFWNAVFHTLKLRVNYIFVIRNPLSVAKSLQKRSNLPIERGLLLWYSYNAYSLLALKQKKLLFIDYDSFLNNPSIYLEKIAINLNLQEDVNERAIFLESFLDKDLRNFASSHDQVYSAQEKNYLKFYKHMLKNSTQNFLDEHFFNAYAKDTIYNTLEHMSLEAKNAQNN